jgi:hypothetical protein
MRARFLLVCLAFAASSIACTAITDEEAADEETTSEDALASADAAGVRVGSPEERIVLNLVNDISIDAAGYRTRAKLSKTLSEALVKARAGASASPIDDKFFYSVDEMKPIKGVSKAQFTLLKNYGTAQGYDYAPPGLILMEIPDNLGRPPTSNDVQIARGYDGRLRAPALAMIRANIQNPVHVQNERFVSDSIAASYKAFNVGLSNLFIPGSPPRRFMDSLAPDSVEFLCTISTLNPTIVRYEKDGRVGYLQRAPSGGGYVRADASLIKDDGEIRYPVLLRAKVRFDKPGVQLEYPKWSATVLSAPTSTVTEG